MFWSVVANYIYDATIKNEPPPQIIIQTDGTVVKTGKHTVFISKDVHDATENAKESRRSERTC